MAALMMMMMLLLLVMRPPFSCARRPGTPGARVSWFQAWDINNGMHAMLDGRY